MHEGRQWSAMGVATWTAWGAVGVLLAAMWATLLAGHHEPAGALGFTACALSAVAAALQVRRFTCRTQDMLRALLVPRDPRDLERLHPVR